MFQCRKFFIAILYFFLSTQTLWAQIPHQTALNIYDSSIAWDDVANRKKLLATVPQWPANVMQMLFNVFQNPERYLIPRANNRQQYHIRYINAFWGATDNPFNRYPRPAKLFLFLNGTKQVNSPENFIMAPVIQNAADGIYYIFDMNQVNPVPLNTWISQISSTLGNEAGVRFNVCLSYGNFPTDICDGKSYQDETLAGYKSSIDTLEKFLAKQTFPSAARPFQEDWQITRRKVQGANGDNNNTIFAESIPWNDLPGRTKLLNTVTTWTDYKTIVSNFEALRDVRYFNDENDFDFKRRITWLYPDDGCWTRASAVIKDLFGPINNIVNKFTRPAKIFAFGNLCVNTANSPKGNVTWWYHTAPIIKDAQTNQTYVLDPSVNPYQPTPVETWIATIISNTGACKGSGALIKTFNICNGYGVNPYDYCQNIALINFTSEMYGMLGQNWFRPIERDRQIELGRDPNKVLGDQPPWENQAA